MGTYLTNLGLNTLQVIQGDLSFAPFTKDSNPPPQPELTLTANDTVLPQLAYALKSVVFRPYPNFRLPLPFFASVSLQGLVSIGRDLSISQQKFENLTSFSALKCVGGLINVDQLARPVLSSFAGLESLAFLGYQGTSPPLLTIQGEFQIRPPS